MYSGLEDSRRWVLVDALAEHARLRPDAEWLTDSDGASLGFGQAWSDARRVASFLDALGVAPGDRVAVFMGSGCDFVRAWLGLGVRGAVGVLVNTELRGAFLLHQLQDCRAAVMVVDAALLPAVAEVADRLAHLRVVVVVGQPTVVTPPAWRVEEWGVFARHAEWTGPGPGPADIACVMYTSGTSGPSKGVLMPHAHCALYGVGAIRCLQLTPQDRYYISLPLFHANGLLMQLGATLLAGIPAFVRRRFSASRWLSDVRASRATVTNFLGATAAFVITQPPTPHDADHALRAVMPAPNLPEHDHAFRTRFGVRDVVSGFGMTEVNIPVWGRLGRPAPGAAGWCHEDHFEVRIADPDTDQAMPWGQVGEIQVRPKVPFGFMAGYLDAPDKTVEAWRNLWFHTGDAGTLDASGLLSFVDRIKDCIRRRGENISAAEGEAVVGDVPGVAEAAAYAVPSDVPGGEDEVMIALVPVPGADVDARAVLREVSERLPRFARPRYVKVLDALPKTATGKVQRAVLRKQGTSGATDLDERG